MKAVSDWHHERHCHFHHITVNNVQGEGSWCLRCSHVGKIISQNLETHQTKTTFEILFWMFQQVLSISVYVYPFNRMLFA